MKAMVAGDLISHSVAIEVIENIVDRQNLAERDVAVA